MWLRFFSIWIMRIFVSIISWQSTFRKKGNKFNVNLIVRMKLKRNCYLKIYQEDPSTSYLFHYDVLSWKTKEGLERNVFWKTFLIKLFSKNNIVPTLLNSQSEKLWCLVKQNLCSIIYANKKFANIWQGISNKTSCSYQPLFAWLNSIICWSFCSKLQRT